jgi:aldehyde dehydrogenase (NAD+)
MTTSDGDALEDRLFVDGELRRAATCFAVTNPATTEIVGEVSDGSDDDMADAITAATRASSGVWARDPEFRAHCLQQLHDGLVGVQESLRNVLVAETGSPVAFTYAFQLDWPIRDLAYWTGLATAYDYRQPLPGADVEGVRNERIALRRAAGPVAAITPWNFPLYLNLAKVGPALAAGCSVVLKPAPDTPFSATVLGKIAAETDLPAGVLNVVPSSRHDIGDRLTGDPRIRLVSFTGSTATGKRIIERCAPSVTRTFLELGGKSAAVVLDDADLESVVPIVAGGACMHAGQGCAISTRLLVPRHLYAAAAEIAAATMAQVPVGDPTAPDVLCGPLISERQLARVLDYVALGTSEGRLVTGGHRIDDLRPGWFVEPTLFADVSPDARIAQEEIFGPVLCVIPYVDDDDAVRIANGTRYGLSGEVWGGDPDRATAVAERLDTGTISVNGGTWFGVDAPFGGVAESGIGRENGVAGFEEYLDLLTIGLPPV